MSDEPQYDDSSSTPTPAPAPEPERDDADAPLEALDALDPAGAYVGVDPMYKNAANPTERPVATDDEFVTEQERLTNEITADRAKRDAKTGVRGFTGSSINPDPAE